MSGKPNAAVILLNWNGWRDTIECLRSLEGLDYPSCELVVVDNGSTDDSVARIGEAYPDIALIEAGGNLGFAGGNNLGTRYALQQGAEYVWLLNNDTVADPRALTAMVEVAEEDPKIGAVGSVIYYMDEPERVQAWGAGRVSLWWGIPRYQENPVPWRSLHYITGASLLMKREALREVGLLDEGFFPIYWEDAEFGFRLRKAGWSLAVAEDSRIWHRESTTMNKNTVSKDVHWNASAARFFRKHSRIAFVPIVIGTGGRVLKRLARGDWGHARAVVRGALRGAFGGLPGGVPDGASNVPVRRWALAPGEESGR